MSDVDLKGRVAVVTGASLGIGRATALAFGRAGAKVVVNYRSHREQAEEVVKLIRDGGSKAVAVQADVADQAAVERLIAKAVAEFGKLDIAVSNAAYSDRELFYQADMAGFRRTVDVTMWGAFYLMRAATQQMIKQGSGGAICLVSSPHAFIPAPRAMAYNMSKAAIEHMARTAAIEVAEYQDSHQPHPARLDRHARRAEIRQPRDAGHGRGQNSARPAGHGRGNGRGHPVPVRSAERRT